MSVHFIMLSNVYLYYQRTDWTLLPIIQEMAVRDMSTKYICFAFGSSRHYKKNSEWLFHSERIRLHKSG